MRINPIEITDEKGNFYVLEFSRDSVMFAENHGFDIDNGASKPMTFVSDLFFYAFRMHHPSVARANTDKMLFEDMGGLPDGMLERLRELYLAPFTCLAEDNDDTPEEERKNRKLKITM